MPAKYQILTAIAAIMATEYLVEAQNTRPREPSAIGYFATSRYRRQSAATKLDELWQQCLAEESDAPSHENYNLDDFFRESMRTSFGLQHDEIPVGRVKFNHAQGVVGKFVWEDLGQHPYTGLYSGDSEGLLRFSEGNFLLPETTGLTPTVALKFPIDGVSSINHLANVNFEPTTSWNFFGSHFHTKVPFFTDECAQDSVQKKFLEQTGRPQALGLSRFSRHKADGTEIFDPVFPFDLMFAPHPDLQERFSQWDTTRPFLSNGTEIFWYNQLKSIEEGTVLFQVMARSHPDDPIAYPQSALEHIANIRLTSSLITSIFGDTRLFFQHESMNDDFSFEPEWADYVPNLPRRDADAVWGDRPIADYPEDPVEQKAWVRGQMKEYGCPFAWLFGNTVTPEYDD